MNTHTICKECNGSVPFTRVRNGQRWQIKAFCRTCNRCVPSQQGVWWARALFTLAEEAAMAFDGDESDEPKKLCEFCLESAPLEQHHLFPREAYGPECDKGPTINLCGKCHADWHARMRRIGFVGELREMRSGGQGELADAIARAHDAWKRRPRTDRDGETLPLRAEPSKALAERIERARKASLGEDDEP